MSQSDSPLAELRDALDDAIRRSFCEALEIDWDGGSLLGNNDPMRLRQLTKIQAAAWDAVEGRVG